ncbi:MAG: YjgP/YjgQ family permease [Gemmatimonadales bacterium]|nr:MAG: YjgP/YjgQ family permease [Gemmatimonadales bacterium]
MGIVEPRSNVPPDPWNPGAHEQGDGRNRSLPHRTVAPIQHLVQMRILTRYIVRSHIGPFLFAFTAVTGLLFLNAVARALEDLVGKGLDPGIILEFMLLSLPHIIALTFPMAILVAVLYAFSDMTGNNEITALAAGGVHPARLLIPIALVGVVLTGTMLYFNDRVLPESNHRLANLLADVGRQSPTFELREEVVNEVHTIDDTRYFLRARGIDNATNRLTDVTIYDLSRLGENRTIVAQRGEMAFTPDRRDLYLTLEEGVVFETTDARPGGFQRLYFETQIIPFRGVGTELERRTGGGARSDREMNIAMLRSRADQSLEETHSIADEMLSLSERAVENALEPAPVGDERIVLHEDRLSAPRDHLVAEQASESRVIHHRWGVQYLNVYQYQVEIFKKHSIAFACLVFVLLGAPLAIRYPQGGVGMVIALSLGIFFFYWVGLIVGERFADRGQIHPWVGMWAPNILLLIPALGLMSRMARDMATNRGNRLDELKHLVGALLQRLKGRVGTAAAAPQETAAP